MRRKLYNHFIFNTIVIVGIIVGFIFLLNHENQSTSSFPVEKTQQFSDTTNLKKDITTKKVLSVSLFEFKSTEEIIDSYTIHAEKEMSGYVYKTYQTIKNIVRKI